MYNREEMGRLVSFIADQDGIGDKKQLASCVQQKFDLVKDGKIFYCKWFAIRYCTVSGRGFSNTVLALSKLQKYDVIPFIVCVVTPVRNILLLANSTFLKKISHSSQELRVDNIKGSFNGSDIIREWEGTENIPENFEFLFSTHENFTFEENLVRLVEATHQIEAKGKRFVPSNAQLLSIRNSIDRAIDFLQSEEYEILDQDLRHRVCAMRSEIAIASLIDNVNIRGRVIEYLITAEDDLKVVLMDCLHEKRPLPEIFTADDLGDYERVFDVYWTKTDIKTKVLFLSSNPKGYNIDKLLSFLSRDKSVYLVYIITIDSNRMIQTRLCSMFNKQLLSGTRIIKHWAGRNSRGVAQYDGRALEAIVKDFDRSVDYKQAQAFLEECLHL